MCMCQCVHLALYCTVRLGYVCVDRPFMIKWWRKLQYRVTDGTEGCEAMITEQTVIINLQNNRNRLCLSIYLSICNPVEIILEHHSKHLMHGAACCVIHILKQQKDIQQYYPEKRQNMIHGLNKARVPCRNDSVSTYGLLIMYHCW